MVDNPQNQMKKKAMTKEGQLIEMKERLFFFCFQIPYADIIFLIKFTIYLSLEFKKFS